MLKLTSIGNSLAVVLPKEARACMRLSKGDKLYVTETRDGYRLTLSNPEFGAQMTTARRVMKKRRAALHELAR